jgi:hypothetical protein
MESRPVCFGPTLTFALPFSVAEKKVILYGKFQTALLEDAPSRPELNGQ